MPFYQLELWPADKTCYTSGAQVSSEIPCSLATDNCGLCYQLAPLGGTARVLVLSLLNLPIFLEDQ